MPRYHGAFSLLPPAVMEQICTKGVLQGTMVNLSHSFARKLLFGLVQHIALEVNAKIGVFG